MQHKVFSSLLPLISHINANKMLFKFHRKLSLVLTAIKIVAHKFRKKITTRLPTQFNHRKNQIVIIITTNESSLSQVYS